MARKRTPHPEFQRYAKEMERIKKIILKVHKAPAPHDPEDIGAQALKIRRILEVIVNACLIVQMGFGDRKCLVGSLKDQYPDRAVIYCFLIGILILGLGYVFTYLLSDDRFRAGKPTVEETLRQFGIVPAAR